MSRRHDVHQSEFGERLSRWRDAKCKLVHAVLAALNEYLNRIPSDQKIQLLVDAVRHRNVEIQASGGK